MKKSAETSRCDACSSISDLEIVLDYAYSTPPRFYLCDFCFPNFRQGNEPVLFGKRIAGYDNAPDIKSCFNGGLNSHERREEWLLRPTPILRVYRLRCELCHAPLDGQWVADGRKIYCSSCLRSERKGDSLRELALEMRVLSQQMLLASSLTKKEGKMVTSTEKSDLRDEFEAGLWRAGALEAVETTRVSLIELLSLELAEDERESARAVLAKVLGGKLGTTIVAATAGAAMLTAHHFDLQAPILSEASQIRLGREFRILAVASATTTMIDRFIAPLRNLALDKFGDTIGGVGRAAGLLGRAEKLSKASSVE